MTIKLLRTLVAVADAKTITAAADVVHVTHAAVSQQMRTLENDLGVTLFDRKTRTPELTPVGLQVVAKARSIIADYDNLVPSILGDDGLHGTIRLGALRTTLTGLTPQAMAALKQRFPDVGMHIRPGLTQTLLHDLERGQLDAAIITQPHLAPVGITIRPLIQEPMQLIAAQEEPLDDPLILLARRPFIRFNRNAVLGTLIDNWITAKRIAVNEMMELDSPEAISSMVQSNLGVSIVPDLAVPAVETVPVKRISLGADAPKRTLALAYRSDQVKTRLMDELFATLTYVIERAHDV